MPVFPPLSSTYFSIQDKNKSKRNIVVLVTVKVIVSCHTLHRLYTVVNNNSKCKAN